MCFLSSLLIIYLWMTIVLGIDDEHINVLYNKKKWNLLTWPFKIHKLHARVSNVTCRFPVNAGGRLHQFTCKDILHKPLQLLLWISDTHILWRTASNNYRKFYCLCWKWLTTGEGKYGSCLFADVCTCNRWLQVGRGASFWIQNGHFITKRMKFNVNQIRPTNDFVYKNIPLWHAL